QGGFSSVLTSTSGTTFTPTKMYMGRFFGNTSPFSGILGGQKIWTGSNVLTAAELERESTQYAPVRAAGLLDWWSFNTVTDVIGKYRSTLWVPNGSGHMVSAAG